MKHLFRYEFKRNRTNLIWWSAIIGALILIVMAIYEPLKGYMSTIPAIPGLSDGAAGLGTPAGWWGMEVHQTFMLGGLLFAAMLGASMVASNYRDNSAAYVYSLPMKKSSIIFCKFHIMALNIAILVGVCLVFSSLGMIFLPVNFWKMLLYFFIYAIVLTFIALVTFSLAMLSRKFFSIGAAIGVGFGFYIVNMIVVLVSPTIGANTAKVLSAVTPLGIVDGSILVDGFAAINFWILGFWLIVGTMLFLFSLNRYNKKDVI